MFATIFKPDSFEPQNHFYEKALNANRAPGANLFMNMSISRIIERYVHLNPRVDKKRLTSLLKYKPTHFRWAGADLFNVTTDEGKRKMVLIETNSCPSGQKSLPTSEDNEKGGYKQLIDNTIVHTLKEKENELPEGIYCVMYDKNYMEASGYAATLADSLDQEIFLVKFKNGDANTVKFDDGIMYINMEDGWIPVKAAFRYVTQKPWNRIPLHTKTLIFNPIVACLAGGRNKLVADMAYEFMNSELSDFDGLRIETPYTIRNVKLNEVPLWIKSFGGIGVVKNPYSNAGQGVWTITTPEELNDFMKIKHEYDQFIVQALIGNYNWSSQTPHGKLFHVGTIPNRLNKIYVADLRMMIHYDYTKGCFRPLAMYGRRSLSNLREYLDGVPSWDMLGTNLSVKIGENEWNSDTSRLLLMDQKDFSKLGIGVDDLINGFIQTVLAVVAIDKMSNRLLSNGKFDWDLFKSINSDQELLKEILE